MNESKPHALERVESTGALQALQKDPTKVIRSERLDELRKIYGDKCEIAEIVKDLYTELETTYGISVPADIVIDTDAEGNAVIASVVDRIDGANLEEVEWSEELVPKVEQLYTSIAHYLFEKGHSGEYYLSDINAMTQYVYGVRQGETVAGIYLVDTDVFFNEGRVGLYLVTEWLARHMSGAEKVCKKKFVEARAHMQQFVDEPIPDELTADEQEQLESNISNMRAFLHGEKFGPAPKEAIPTFKK